MLIQDSSVWIALPDSWVSRARDTPSPRVLTCPLTKSAAAAFRTCLALAVMLLARILVLLHYIYWDALADMQELTGLTTKWASTLMAQHLLAAADRYVATTLALAEQHHCFPLKSVCLKFVAMPENLRAVMQTDAFEHLKESCPAVLTELLEYVARVGEHSVAICRHETMLDGSFI
ncbi:hypothetical protein C5167_023409 [Papaver somniferum]|uniref:BPM/SPOP BACK domain-containing protein n=1 Tax=Papaver somniferum TaxID=3469 RepID=A0A4Y7JPJ0_PAPSO|nr:hypothetical protein C5167_023409 [Papaver somniferum]